MHEQHISVFLPDGDDEAVPSSVEGMLFPIHPLQITDMGMVTAGTVSTSRTSREHAP
jgi:hypothetical protein